MAVAEDIGCNNMVCVEAQNVKEQSFMKMAQQEK